MPSQYIYSDYFEVNQNNVTQNKSFTLDSPLTYIIGVFNNGTIKADMEISLVYPSCVKVDPDMLKSIILFLCIIGFVILVVAIVVFVKCVFCKRQKLNENYIKKEKIKKFEKSAPNRKYSQVMRFLDYINAPDKKMTECIICLQLFNKEDHTKVLFCLHYFHEKCIMNWLNENLFCPLCKSSIDKENLEISMSTIKLKYQDTIGSNKFIQSLEENLAKVDISETLNDLVLNTTHMSHNSAIFSADNSTNNVFETGDIDGIDEAQYRRKKSTVHIKRDL